MPASSQASSELSTASLMVVSRAFEGLSKPSRWRFLAKNSETEISRCFVAIDSAVARWAARAPASPGGAPRPRARPPRPSASRRPEGPSPPRRSPRPPPAPPRRRDRAGDGPPCPSSPPLCAFANTSPSLRVLDKRGSLASHAERPGEVRRRDRTGRDDYDGLVSGARLALERLAATPVSSPLLSRMTGRLSDLRLPRPVLAPADPRLRARFRGRPRRGRAAARAYPSFNAFFTRRLREGARPLRGERCRRLAVRLAAERDRHRPAGRPARAGQGLELLDRGPAGLGRGRARPSAGARTRRST